MTIPPAPNHSVSNEMTVFGSSSLSSAPCSNPAGPVLLLKLSTTFELLQHQMPEYFHGHDEFFNP